MKTAEKYNFADFTRDNYRRLLRLAKLNYNFTNFGNLNTDESFIILRHDIDYSPHAARKMAKIEAEEGIEATYFVLLHSEFYNLIEKEITDYLREILDLGHHLGLHFDCKYYNIKNEEHLSSLLCWECGILEEIFDRKIGVFSFHNPTPEILKYGDFQYSGLINTYAEYFRKEIYYCSDSNGYWRFQRLEDILRKADADRLQILIHPEMWQETVMSPKERIYRCIEGRAEKAKSVYEKILRESNRENLDWE